LLIVISIKQKIVFALISNFLKFQIIIFIIVVLIVFIISVIVLLLQVAMFEQNCKKIFNKKFFTFCFVDLNNIVNINKDILLLMKKV